MRTKKVDLSTYNLLKIQFTNGKKAEKTGIEILNFNMCLHTYDNLMRV